MDVNTTYEFLGYKYKIEASFEDSLVGDGSTDRECTVLEVFGPDGSEISGELNYIYPSRTARDLGVSLLDLIETEARESL
jgi:hypothetical protein|tara:strand:+ start:1352 stop:1591 length:240 start_codon:yes stop_codon:yes gene_type:complete